MTLTNANTSEVMNIYYPEIFCNDVYFKSDFTVEQWQILQDIYLARYTKHPDCISLCCDIKSNH